MVSLASITPIETKPNGSGSPSPAESALLSPNKGEFQPTTFIIDSGNSKDGLRSIVDLT